MALPSSQIDALTTKLIKEKATFGVFNSNEFTKRLRAKQEIEDGGTQITCPIATVDDTGTTGSFYDSRDALSLDEYDGFSASVHDWKYIEESCVIYKADIAKNGGKYGVAKLVGNKVMQAEKAMQQRIIKGALSDGTAATGALTTKQFVGLNAVIASSGSYGSISSTDLASWVSYVDDNSGSNRALTQAIWDKAIAQTIETGLGGCTLGLVDKNVFTKMFGLLTPQQRTMRDSSASGQGHKGTVLVYAGIDHMVENNMPANTAFFVDENHFKLHVHRDNNMRVQEETNLETADAQLRRIFLYGNTIASERKFHSRVNDITV
jgi:hypothetical protein